VKWSDCEDLLEVKSEMTAIAGGVVSSIKIVFRTLNTSPGVVGGQRTSANRDKFDSRPAILSPFIACRTLVLLCIFIFIDLCSFIKLSFLYFIIISQIMHSLQGIQTIAVELVFAD